MKTATIADMEHGVRNLLKWVANGEDIEIIQHRKVVARIVPPLAVEKKPVLPDFMARLKRTFPRGVRGKPASVIIDEERVVRP
jgi:antitoxin (DNA-binding transcriptional repressor) of toxin-antitoxin stability system